MRHSRFKNVTSEALFLCMKVKGVKPVEDEEIVRLYWERSETAIEETAQKYGTYCHTIARNILYSDGEAEECVNDTYWNAWNSMPPHRPKVLRTFLGKLTRNTALNRYESNHAEKRGKGQVPLVLEELEECLSSGDGLDHLADELALTEVLNQFLEELPAEQRKLFMGRYWYFRSIRELARSSHSTESKVKMSLLRARNALKQRLEQEGLYEG